MGRIIESGAWGTYMSIYIVTYSESWGSNKWGEKSCVDKKWAVYLLVYVGWTYLSENTSNKSGFILNECLNESKNFSWM